VSARAWSRLIAKRLAGTLIVLMVVSLGVFTLLYLAPGSVEQTLLGTKPVTPETVAAVRAQYHLNEPFLAQYLRWLGGALQGNFGTSIRTGAVVSAMITARLPLTLELVAYGTALAVLIGLPLGVLGAVRRGSATDSTIVAVSVAGLSAPSFAVGLLLLLVFAVRLGWFPVYGVGDGALDQLWHLTLPALALAIGGIGLIVRFTRTALASSLDQDYITFARARGLPRRVVLGCAMRNSVIPVLTAIGLIVTSLIVATVLVEVVFALPGLGSLLVDSVTFKDIPVVQAIALLLTLLISVVNLVVDISYNLVDPRIQLEGSPR